MRPTTATAIAISLALCIPLLAGALGPAPMPLVKLDDHLLAALDSHPAQEPLRVLVTTTGAPAAAILAASDSGATITWTYDIIDGFAATMTPEQIAATAARSDVEKVWLDRPVTTLMDISTRAIGADKAWAAGYDGSGITVAVIDTGIDRLHPFFTGAIVSCVSTISGLVSPECTDSDGHGTHVAGSVASRDVDYPGVAPGASLAIVRVLHAAGSGTSSDIIAGMNWVKNNKNAVSPPIRIATMSIGFLNPGCGDDSSPEAVAANNLVASGVTFTVAAGNAGHTKCTIDGASAASKVITIAAIDDRNTATQDDDVIADFSSGGPTKDGRLKPDVAFPGVDISSAYVGFLIMSLDGTSMATPHAAGTAALMLDKTPSLTATQVKDTMLQTAVKTAATGNSANVVYGHGLGNACKALGLTTCATTTPPPPPTDVHVSSITMAFGHTGGKNPRHNVDVTVRIVDAAGAPVQGATVTLDLTSPEPTQYALSGTTGADGTVTLSANQHSGGHGTWTACVTGVSGTNLAYKPNSNTETCDTLVVT